MTMISNNNCFEMRKICAVAISALSAQFVIRIISLFRYLDRYPRSTSSSSSQLNPRPEPNLRYRGRTLPTLTFASYSLWFSLARVLRASVAGPWKHDDVVLIMVKGWNVLIRFLRELLPPDGPLPRPHF